MTQTQKAIDSLTTEGRSFPPPVSIKTKAHIKSF
jgi:hypothetical protein